ncbi:hypothetical protein GTA08_BOTSDO08527 [Botryosphaeria dothidea]|uniref:Uncharacterized protein n=1 Tax=Botryosphaeria dothidea TaxID=55169 RepID=A0A8H4IPR1_9PEZI|nr:hypothetical protein GTA08_BOTSDO08527 [Botryosphaeria dothidea]
MSAETEHELGRISANAAQNSVADREEAGSTTSAHESSLPPVDGGKDAWLMLVSAFFIESSVWVFGMPLEFSGTTIRRMSLSRPTRLTLPSWEQKHWVSCISGPRSDCPSCRPCSIAGLFISSGALAVSSFATHVWQLILIPALSLHHARPRIHVAARTRDGRASRRTPSLRFVLPRRFLVYQLGNVLHGLGYFLPSYARARARSACAPPRMEHPMLKVELEDETPAGI